MAATYDAKPEWRARWKLDDQGVIRVRKSVTRAASSLPALIMFALAPREGAGEWLGLAALSLGVLGLGGLLARRTWSLFALAGAGATTLTMALNAPILTAGLDRFNLYTAGIWPEGPVLGFYAGALLLVATLPFATPMMAYLRRR
jgi:hypothetical protein